MLKDQGTNAIDLGVGLLMLGWASVAGLSCILSPALTATLGIALGGVAAWSLSGRAPWRRVWARDLVAGGASVGIVMLAIAIGVGVSTRRPARHASRRSVPSAAPKQDSGNESRPDLAAVERLSNAEHEISSQLDDIERRLSRRDHVEAAEALESIAQAHPDLAALATTAGERLEANDGPDSPAVEPEATVLRLVGRYRALVHRSQSELSRIGDTCWQAMEAAAPESERAEDRVVARCARQLRVSRAVVEAALVRRHVEWVSRLRKQPPYNPRSAASPPPGQGSRIGEDHVIGCSTAELYETAMQVAVERGDPRLVPGCIHLPRGLRVRPGETRGLLDPLLRVRVERTGEVYWVRESHVEGRT